MIVNIPIQVDEEAIEEKTLKEYKSEVNKLLVERIERVLLQETDGWRWGNKQTAQDGMRTLVNRTVERYVDEYMEKHTGEILDKAVDKLEQRLRNRKRIKEVE